jgi:hypothetical protein
VKQKDLTLPSSSFTSLTTLFLLLPLADPPQLCLVGPRPAVTQCRCAVKQKCAQPVTPMHHCCNTLVRGAAEPQRSRLLNSFYPPRTTYYQADRANLAQQQQGESGENPEIRSTTGRCTGPRLRPDSLALRSDQNLPFSSFCSQKASFFFLLSKKTCLAQKKPENTAK